MKRNFQKKEIVFIVVKFNFNKVEEADLNLNRYVFLLVKYARKNREDNED